MRNPPVFLLFLLLPACLVRHETTDGWQKVKVIRLDTESIAIHGLALNQQGVLLAAGYTEQSYDCGPLDAGVCKLYRLYRSFNEGSTWEEVSDSLIAYRHAFVKDDNLPNRVAGTNPIGRAIIIAKEAVSSVFYMDHQAKGRFFNVGNDFYLLVDDNLYRSRDNAATWQELRFESANQSYGVPYYTEWDLVEMVGNQLVVHHYINGNFSRYKRSPKGFREIGTRKHCTILHTVTGEKKLLLESGKNLASPYYPDGLNRISHNGPPDSVARYLSSIHETGTGTLYATVLNNFKRMNGEQDRRNTVHLWKSEDKGLTFEKVKLGELNQDKSVGDVKVLSRYGEYLILMIGETVFNNEKAEAAETFLQEFYLYGIVTGSLQKFPFPEGTHGLNKGVKVFLVDGNSIYCGTPEGLYKTSKLPW